MHEIRLVEGALVRGRLVHNGQPVTNAQVRADRFGAESGSIFWYTNTFTDSQGHFSFPHLPPSRSCRLHGRSGALADLGVVPVRSVSIPGNGATNDIGDVELDPAFRAEGRIELSDGEAVPDGSYLYFGNYDLVMSGRQAIGGDGTFRLRGLAAGRATVYLRVPHYELTPRDALLKSGSATNLTVSSNISGWRIIMRPATRR